MKSIFFKNAKGELSEGEIREIFLCVDHAWHAAHSPLPGVEGEDMDRAMGELETSFRYCLGDEIALTVSRCNRAEWEAEQFPGGRKSRCIGTFDDFEDSEWSDIETWLEETLTDILYVLGYLQNFVN